MTHVRVVPGSNTTVLECDEGFTLPETEVVEVRCDAVSKTWVPVQEGRELRTCQLDEEKHCEVSDSRHEG